MESLQIKIEKLVNFAVMKYKDEEIFWTIAGKILGVELNGQVNHMESGERILFY